MAARKPFIRSGILGELKYYLSPDGKRFDDLAGKVGLPAGADSDPLQRLPLETAMHLFDLAARDLSNPAFAFDFAGKLKPKNAGLIGEIIVTAPTVRDGLRDVADLISVFMSPFEVSFTESNGLGHGQWRYPASVTAPRVQFNMFLAATLIRTLRTAIAPDWTPRAVQFDHVAPDCPEEIRAIFGSRVQFGSDHNAMFFDSTALSRPMPLANATRASIMRDLARRWIKEIAVWPDAVQQTHDSIVELLPKGRAGLDSVAARVGISATALQWRLQQAGTSFEKVLTEVRKNRAATLLRDTDQPLTEIAFDLGFSDPSSFTRAATRWFNMTPSEWRKKSRA